MSGSVRRSEDFIGSLGINTHLGESDVGVGYSNANTVLSQLEDLGLSHIREALPGAVSPQQTAEADQLAAAGIKFDVLIPGNGPVDLTADMTLLDAFAAKHPGAIASVEGPNEVDIWPITYHGRSGYAAAVAFQHDLYAAVHADPLLSGVPVYNFTLGGILPADAGIGNVSASADAGNVHTYAPNGIRPSWVIPAAIQGFAADVPNKPTVVTETNYYTLPNDSDWGGVNETVQAVYGLDTALDDFKNGVSATYFYELEDEGTANDREQHFGLFRADGTPKPFAAGLHALTTLLADPGAGARSFTTTSLGYTIGNLPWTASSIVVEKSSGVFDLVVWDEQALWNSSTHRQLAATSTPITVHLAVKAAHVTVYDPLQGVTPLAQYSNALDIALPLSSDPLIFEITPASPPVAGPATTMLPPAIKIITGNRDGGVTVAGSAKANSTVTVTDTVNGATTTLGTAIASAMGTWSLTSHVAVNMSTINSYGASAMDGAGQSATMPGALMLASTGHDTLVSTPGASNVFAIMSFRGSDVIEGFKASGPAHDEIDFSGRGITSFSQVQSMLSGVTDSLLSIGSGKTITLAGVAPSSLIASDFRFS